MHSGGSPHAERHVSSSHQVTQLLSNWSRGDPKAREELLPLVYDELRRLAHSYLRRERSDHTLQATALVHEAYLRLVDQSDVQWSNRGHFFAITAQAMRRILVDHARGHQAAKRGGEGEKIPLEDAFALSNDRPDKFLALDESLRRLAEIDGRQEQVVELRVFAGMNIEEIAEVLNISPATVKRDWTMAKAWLSLEIGTKKD
jgi:RNA polymerase sigma factor (TIGR02999 family)